MIRIAICDDDTSILESVGQMVSSFARQYPQLGISERKFHSVYDLMECMERDDRTFHIYLLDIIMPLINGIEIGRHIRKTDDQAIIIYLTSSEEYALQAFQVSPFQYLVKPIQKDVLCATLEKACTKIKQALDDNILVRVKGGIAYIRYHQISYIEYVNHTMVYHLNTEKTMTTMVIRESFTDFTEQYLNDRRFIKPHASFVVNMDYVQMMTSKEFEMMGGDLVPISKRSYTQVRKQFMEYMLTRQDEAVEKAPRS